MMNQPVRVAVIGGGVAGIVVAKECRAAGLEVVGFESCKTLGGLWNPNSKYSHIWPSMRLNTSRRMVCFSDFPMPEPEGCDPFPTNKEYLDYIGSYCETFEVASLFRTEVTVDKVERSANGKWSLKINGMAEEEVFDHVVICVGNYVKPHKPDIAGAKDFKGVIAHAGEMKHHSVKGKSVVVQGSNISGAQLAAVAGTHGKACFHSQRTPRYHAEIYAGNRSVTEFLFQRSALWMKPFMKTEDIAKDLKKKVHNPGKFGGKFAEANEDPTKAGVTISHGYLKLMSEGKITAKPAIKRVEGKTVYFADNSSAEVDIICQATGYIPASKLMKDMLPSEVMAKVGEATDLDVYKWTFHPEVPDIAFCGLQRAMGSVIPCCELQARWIAAVFSGRNKLPSKDTMAKWMEGARFLKSDKNQNRLSKDANSQGLMMDELAWEIGCFPNLFFNFMNAYTLVVGPMFPAQYRISGPGCTKDALERVLYYNKHPLLKVPEAAEILDTQDPPYVATA